MISLPSVQCASNAISTLLFLPYTRAYICAYISATWLELPLNPVLYRELEFLWTFFRFKRVLMANFLISSTINTDEATDINNKMSVQYRASVWKTAWSGGKWITSICPMGEPPTAYRNMRFVKKPTWKVDLTSRREIHMVMIIVVIVDSELTTHTKSWSLPFFTPFIWLSISWTSLKDGHLISVGLNRCVRLGQCWL